MEHYLELTDLVHNNLGNLGKDKGAEGMRFNNVFPFRDDGKQVCLVVNAGEGYQRSLKPDRQNGLNAKIAKINLVCGTSAALTFSFVDCTTNEPVPVGPFYMSFLDFDQDNAGGSETVTVHGAAGYEVTDSTVIDVQEGDGSITFKSTEFGTKKDNVGDVMNMDDGQKDKAVVVQMGCVTTFKVDYEAGPGHNNRFFQFTGLTNQPGCPKGDTCEEAGCKAGQGCCLSPNWKGELAVKQVYKKPKLVNKKKCIKKEGNVWCGTAGYPDPPQPIATTTSTTTTTTTTTPAGPPDSCGNQCANFKKCEAHGDPHYIADFGGTDGLVLGRNHYDIQGLGVQTLAKTKCGSFEMQSIQCPFHNNRNPDGTPWTAALGYAIRFGEKVVVILGDKVHRNDGNIPVTGGFPNWYIKNTNPNMECIDLWVRTAGRPGSAARFNINGFWMGFKLHLVDPALEGTCSGERKQSPTPKNEILFNTVEVGYFCGRCGFSCDAAGNLLEISSNSSQPDNGGGDAANSDEERAQAEAACVKHGIDIEQASKECMRVDDETAEGKDPFVHWSCVFDYCAAGGADWVVNEEVEDEKMFEAPGPDEAVSLLQTDPGDKDLCNDLIKNEDANMDSPDDFKRWCQTEQGFPEADCNRALEKLGEHPWTQEKIDSVCDDEALA